MSEVKRYDISAFGGMSMDECTDGAYVNYDDYAALEAKCAGLAAENAGLKSAISAVNRTAEECEVNGDEIKYVVEPSEFDALFDLLDETPATDAILAEVRAQGVEMLRDSIANIESGTENTIDLHHYCTDFASQIRQEAAQ